MKRDLNCLPCFVCNKDLIAVRTADDNQPHGGIGFSTSGHYGSTYFDATDLDGSQKLELAICDECLQLYEDRTRIVRYWVEHKMEVIK
jgi:hypothetical protein